MNDRQIQMFLEIVHQNNSFTKAATALFISQPALSKQIGRLEAELGTSLFDTSQKKAVTLTESGKLYYEYFSKERKRFAKLQKEVSRIDESKTKNLKIGCISGMGLGEILSKTRDYEQKHPDVQIQFIPMDTSALLESLEQGKLDAAIAMSILFENNKNYESQILAEVPLIFLYSDKCELAGKENVKPQDFESVPLYVINEEEADQALPFNKKICDYYGIQPHIIKMPTMESIVLEITSRDGFTINSYWNRVKDAPEYRYLKLDLEENMGMFWLKDVAGQALLDYIDGIRW